MQITQIDGIKVRHLTEGQGPPVVVLHGWGASIETVASIVSALSPVVTVHALDLPGFGQSDPPPYPWGVEDYTAFLARFLHELRIQRASFVGHSNGGRIIISLAASQPRLVGRIVLVDSAGIKPKRTLSYYRKVGLAKVGKHAARLLGPPGKRLQQALAAKSASPDYAAASQIMRPTFVKLVNTDLQHLLPKVASPTLLVWGENDTATPIADAKLMERLIPDAGLVVLQGASHYSYLDEPHRFATIVRHFLGDAGGGEDGCETQSTPGARSPRPDADGSPRAEEAA